MSVVPEVPWAPVAGRVQRGWQPTEANPHMVFLAQTRSGKDHTVRYGILPYCAPVARTVVLIVKAGEDRTWDGDPEKGTVPWGNAIEPGELRPGFSLGADGTPRYRIHLNRKISTAQCARRRCPKEIVGLSPAPRRALWCKAAQ